MNLRYSAPVALVTLASVCSLPLVAAHAQETELQKRLDTILAAPGFRPASVSVLVRSLDDGRTLYERNADTVVCPASNNKILTASTALARLGTGYRYHTMLYRTGTVGPDGTLNGDLYLRGTGDPSFSSEDLLVLAKALRAQGITRIADTSRFVADATRFTDAALGSGWPWDDDPYYYQAQISALSCDENVVALSVAPGTTPGTPALVSYGGPKAAALGFPGTTYLSVRSTATTVASADPKKPETNLTFDRPRARNVFLIRGKIAVGAKPAAEALTIEDPDIFTMTRLTEVLPLAGVVVPEPLARRIGRGTVPAEATVVAEKVSEPLPVLTRHFLKTSDNLYGELFLRTIGAEKGKEGNADEGASVVRSLLHDAGVDDTGWRMADGSGLSREDLVSARQLVGVLTYVDTKFPAETRAAFEDALPVGGVDGTLRNRFKGTVASGVVHAKTGSLNRVSSLSGFVTTKAGERLVFSILMNHHTGGTVVAHGAQDAIVLALMDAPRPERK